jgi:putative SOS response-associated peptidase YedK
MPVVLEAADRPTWLGETKAGSAALLRPSAAEFRTWRIGTAVNSVRNDSAALLGPV